MTQTQALHIRPARYHEYRLGLMLFPDSVKHFAAYQLFLQFEGDRPTAAALLAPATVRQQERAYHVDFNLLQERSDASDKTALLSYLQITARQLCANALYSVRPTSDPEQVRFFTQQGFQPLYDFVGWQFEYELARFNRLRTFAERLERKLAGQLRIVPYTEVAREELQALHMANLNHLPPGFFHAFSNTGELQQQYHASRCILIDGKLAGLAVNAIEGDALLIEALIVQEEFRLKGATGVLLYHFIKYALDIGLNYIQMFCDSRNRQVMNLARRFTAEELWRRTQYRLEL